MNRDDAKLEESQTGTVQEEEILQSSEDARLTRRKRPDGHSVLVKQAIGSRGKRRMTHEAGILQRLDHVPGVIKIVAVAGESKTLMPSTLMLSDDRSMALERFMRSSALSVAQVVDYAQAVACVLSGVHQAGVIHNDICPASLLIHPQTLQPTLIDFNNAVVISERQAGTESSGEIVCNWSYMSPERTGRIGRSPDARSDLYSLGITLYELLTQRKPFDTEDLLELMHDHLVRVPEAPCNVDPAVPRIVSDLVLHLLEKEPDRRYQSADGLAQDLQRISAALSNGNTTPFQLGQFDFGSRLNPPPCLIGRDTELATLRELVSHAAERSTRCVLLAGPAGVGKSAMLDKLRPMVAQKAWLVCSRLEQYGQDSASAALDIFRVLGRQLLAEPEERLALYRARIAEELGDSLGVGPSLLPEFQLLLGKHAAIELSDPREVEPRITQTALGLLRAVASSERPVVLVYDDVHWAPSISRRLLDEIVAGPAPIPNLMLVCAYRDDEVVAGHPLGVLFERWKKLGLTPPQLVLNNLSATAASEFVGAMLHMPEHEASELAEVLSERTQHNVYNTIEFLNALRQAGLLVPRNGRWHWDAASIRRDVGSASVADLLSRRIGKLMPAACELLQIVACLGVEASTSVLTLASGLEATEVQRRLLPSLDDGLLTRAPGEPLLIRFTNGRVQQAVLKSMSIEQRRCMHLALARRLAEHCSDCPGLDALTAEQYLDAIDAVSEVCERRRALNLFEHAAQCVRLLNGEVAERYFAAAIILLSTIATPADRQQLYRLRVEHHRALFSLGRLEEGDALYDWLAANADSPAALSEPTRIQVYAYSNRRRFPDALALGLGLLHQVGLVKPADIQSELSTGFKRLAAWNRSDAKLKDLDRPEASDPQTLAWATMISECTMPAYFCEPPIWVWLNLEALRLWIEDGPSTKLMRSFTGLCALPVGALQDYRGSYDVGRHLLRVGEARGYEPSTSGMRAMFGLTAAHWVEPIEAAAAQFLRARADLMRLGDEYFFAVTFVAFDHIFDYSPTLETAAADLELGLATAARSGNADFRLRFQPRKQLLLALRGETNTPGGFDTADFDEAAYQQAIDPAGPTAATYHTMRALAAAIFGDTPTLATHTAKAMLLSPRIPGYYIWAIARVLHAVTLSERARALPHAERAPAIAELDSSCVQWLTARAADAPDNFLHLLRWVQAERAWATESIWAAGAAFDAAMQEAALHARPWHRAIIIERAALFQLDHGMAHSAHKLLMQACDMYEAWGGAGKVNELRRIHACLRTDGKLHRATSAHTDVIIDTQMVDMMAILRASQALSSETSLERLTDAVSKVLGALTGATRVQLIVRSEEGTWVLADSLGSGSEAGARGQFPMAALRYCERTGELLVIDDATRDARFSFDPYVQQFDQCSLLLSPVLKQGRLHAMLVLENNQRRAAFSTDRLDSVALIAGQLSVSLDNALLYASLEKRVVERTAELRRKTNDVNAMLQNMPQGVLTIIAGGVIHAEYSAYLETILELRGFTHRSVMDVIFSNSSLDANVLAQMHTAIGACIGAGQMNYELNAHLLASGFDKTLPDGRVKSLASSWSPICDEHGLVAKLLLCIRDVTEIKRLENEANTRKRQLQMIGEILAVVQERFHAFAASATNFLEENRRLLEQASEPCADMANHLFRNMHTVKGSARTLALLELTNRAHLAEQSYAGLRKNPDAAWDRNHLLAELATVREMLDKYVDVNDTVLGRKGPGRRREIEKFLMVERSSVQELLRELMSVDQSNASAMHGALEHVGRMLNAVNTAQGPTAS